MRVLVELSKNKKEEVNLPNTSKVENLLIQLKLFPDAVIVISNGSVLPVDAPLSNNQNIKIIRVTSGG